MKRLTAWIDYHRQDGLVIFCFLLLADCFIPIILINPATVIYAIKTGVVDYYCQYF